jgi:hypothetical protein
MAKKHERKMLTMPGHKGNANQNYTKFPYQEHHQQQMSARMLRKRNVHTLLVECKLGKPLWKTI